MPTHRPRTPQAMSDLAGKQAALKEVDDQLKALNDNLDVCLPCPWQLG